MISSKDEYSIRSSFPVPESPLDLLIAKEDPADSSASNTRLDVELLIFLADFAARNPHKWRTVKERVENARASINDLALLLKINRRTVLRHFEDLRAEAKKWNGSPFVEYERPTSTLQSNEREQSERQQSFERSTSN